MSEACARSWEVEAARLGQLRGSQLDAHREHLASGCAVCAAELLRHGALVSWLRSADPPVDEVALRRLRRDTLARAHALTVDSPRSVLRGVVRALWLGLTFAAGAACAVWWSLALAVERPAHTVSMSEPRVAVRGSAAHVATARQDAPEPAAVTGPAVARAPVAPRKRMRAVLTPEPPRAVMPAPAPVESRAQDREDAAYLRILGLWRTRELESLQLAAADYLARFPDGFRRIEVEQLRLRIDAPHARAAHWGTVGAPRQNAPSAP